MGPVLVDEDILVPSDVERHDGDAHGGMRERTLRDGGDVIVARQRKQTERQDETIVNYLRVRYLLNCNLNPVAMLRPQSAVKHHGDQVNVAAIGSFGWHEVDTVPGY